MYTIKNRIDRIFLGLFLAAACLATPAVSFAGTHLDKLSNSLYVTLDMGNLPTPAPGKWITLFDGKNTDAWKSFNKDGFPSGWQVKDGTLTLVGKGAGDIITKQEFENYELEIEWKISEGGNSGIIYNVVEDPKHHATYETGPEMQVLDNERHPDAKAGKDGNRTAGANYDLIPPSKAAKPAGEWNKAKLVVNKGHVEHWLNGTKVVEYQLWSPEWKAMVAKSKFASMPDYGLAHKGHIALQDHGNPVWFRNIRIREL